jgi:hypothetical protein
MVCRMMASSDVMAITKWSVLGQTQRHKQRCDLRVNEDTALD